MLTKPQKALYSIGRERPSKVSHNHTRDSYSVVEVRVSYVRFDFHILVASLELFLWCSFTFKELIKQILSSPYDRIVILEITYSKAKRCNFPILQLTFVQSLSNS